MNRIVRAVVIGLGVTVPLCGIAAAAQAPVAPADLVHGVWRHHKSTFNYFGITASYSCDALEDRVKSILVHFGARKDAKVFANGCPRGSEVPSRTAWVETDFYTLAPAESVSGETIEAHWAPREVTPRRPYFMGDGDCELIEQMKDLISKGFSLRDVQYRTECVPHQIVVNGFSIKGQALVPVATSNGAKGA